jgi:hypothetical protein
LDSLKTATGREDIDLFGQMVGKPISQKEGNGGTRGNGSIRYQPDIPLIPSNQVLCLNFPVGPFRVENSLQFDPPSGKKFCVIGWGISHRILKVKRVGTPEDEVLEEVICSELFKEEFDKRLGNGADHVKFKSTTNLPPEEKMLTDFALHHIDQRRNRRIISEVAHLPCPRIANGIDAIGFAHIFEKDSFRHSKPPIQDIRVSEYQVTRKSGENRGKFFLLSCYPDVPVS